jgi:hypothetical protein
MYDTEANYLLTFGYFDSTRIMRPWIIDILTISLKVCFIFSRAVAFQKRLFFKSGCLDQWGPRQPG